MYLAGFFSINTLAVGNESTSFVSVCAMSNKESSKLFFANALFSTVGIKYNAMRAACPRVNMVLIYYVNETSERE